MKKLVSLTLVLVLMLAMCITAGAEDFKFERKIEIVCPWGLGGGADGTIRPMAQLLQEILGVPVEVRNETGAGGVNGLEYAYKQPADGYTFLLGTQSLFIQDISGQTSMDFYGDMQCMDVLVHSINMLYASKSQMEKYGVTNFEELKEYVAANPYKVTVGMMTATGVDGMCFALATEGLALMEMTYGDGTEINSALAGGHLDLAVGGYDDVSGLIESGDVIPMLVFCEHRIDIAPDCMCTAEVGIDSYAGPWRALFAKEGTPQGAIDAVIAAVEEARNNQLWIDFCKRAAYDQRAVPAPGEETEEFVKNDYQDLYNYYLEEELLEKEYECFNTAE